MAIRVQNNSEDFGRCGCGRRDYCDGSHGLSEAQWVALQATELEAAQEQAQEQAREEASATED